MRKSSSLGRSKTYPYPQFLAWGKTSSILGARNGPLLPQNPLEKLGGEAPTFSNGFCCRRWPFRALCLSRDGAGDALSTCAIRGGRLDVRFPCPPLCRGRQGRGCRCALLAIICVIGVVWAGPGPPGEGRTRAQAHIREPEETEI